MVEYVIKKISNDETLQKCHALFRAEATVNLLRK